MLDMITTFLHVLSYALPESMGPVRLFLSLLRSPMLGLFDNIFTCSVCHMHYLKVWVQKDFF